MLKFILPWLSRIIIRILENDALKIFRKLEKESRKLIIAELHRNFNVICIKEDLLPKYTNFLL